MQDLVIVILYFLFFSLTYFDLVMFFLSRFFNLFISVRLRPLPRYKEHVTCLTILIQELNAEYFFTVYEQCVLDTTKHVSALQLIGKFYSGYELNDNKFRELQTETPISPF